MIKRIFTLLLPLLLLLGSFPLSVFADDYWSLREEYLIALDSGDSERILSAVKKIEALYPNTETSSELERLVYPVSSAAKIYETLGDFNMSREYYGKYLDYSKKLLELGEIDYYSNYQSAKMLYEHNSVIPRVYAETADTSLMPYYGARCEAPAGTYHGMTSYFDKEYDNAQILYVQFFNEDIEPFNWQLPDDTDDYLLMVAWNVPNENYEDLERIANGEADEYIRRNLEYLSTLKCKILIRFGGEVNCWASLPTTREDFEKYGKQFIDKFKEAFIKISNSVKEYCPKAGMIYSPNDISNWYFTHEDFYPGDEYVDWVGMSTYCNDTSETEFELSSGSDAYYCHGDYYENQIIKIAPIVKAYSDRKPIIITEGGYCYKSEDGVQSVDHASEAMEYFYTYLSRVYPQIKCVMYFNANFGDNHYRLFGTEDKHDDLGELYRELNCNNVSMEYSMGRGELCGYTELKNIDEVLDSLNLSVYASYPTTEDITVSYSLNGSKVYSSDNYPYSFSINASDLKAGSYILGVSVSCMKTSSEYRYKLELSDEGRFTVSDVKIPESISDVAEDFWGYEAVEFCINVGLFRGVSETTFEPNSPMTRAMFVTVLARAVGADTTVYADESFDDVLKGSWYFGAVEWAREHGIINGKTEDLFAPNDNITREQMCAVLVRFADSFGLEFKPSGLDEKTENTDTPETSDTETNDTEDILTELFADDDLISNYARDSVYVAKNSGLVNGRQNNMFAPKDNASRAECATIFMRLITQYIKVL